MEDHMQFPPPTYANANANANAQLPPIQTLPPADPPPIHPERTLPPLPPAPIDARYRQDPVLEAQFWPSSNPLTAYYNTIPPSQLSPKKSPPRNSLDSPSAMDVDTPSSRGRRGGSVLSIDDPDVRIAAEALGDLRADFIQSPPHLSLPSPLGFHNHTQPEPLLTLLSTSHPLIGTAIGGSLSAYSASKNYSPRFKSSAEYVERRFTPVVNTVGSVGRITGVESGVRWFLGNRRPSTQENDEGSNKRRKVRTNSDSDMNQSYPHDPYPVFREHSQHHPRRTSQVSTSDSLPAYDDHRSPEYEAPGQALIQRSDEPTSPGGSWHSRLVLSTSGLSVAMSEESLRSLKYCLGWLRWANEHIGKVIDALKAALEQYDQGSTSNAGSITEGWTYPGSGKENASGQLVVRNEQERSELNAKIAELKKDVLKTLKDVVDIVSKYAGGALPENARVLVRRHLTSLPQRFRLANTASAKASRSGEHDDREVTEGANRVMLLAKEGLDMMAQVSGVLDGTIVSAEEWCERLGRKKREDDEKANGAAVSSEEPQLMAVDGAEAATEMEATRATEATEVTEAFPAA